MWPLWWQGMLYTFIKANNTAAVLYILNTITVKSLQYITINVTETNPSREANSCSATHSIPCLLQHKWVHYYFHHSLTHTLSANFLSPPIFCSYTHSSLNNIAITVHMFSALQTPCWHNKMRDWKSETVTNNGTTDPNYRSQNGTNNIWRIWNHKHHQP